MASAFDVQGWDVRPLLTSGQFQGCSMEADYDDNTTVGLLVTPQGNWGLMLTNRSWNYGKGSRTAATLAIDGQLIASGTAEALERNLLVLQLGGVRVYQALQEGFNALIELENDTLTLSLDGTYAAMDAVLTCVRSYRG